MLPEDPEACAFLILFGGVKVARELISAKSTSKRLSSHANSNWTTYNP
jgi:hypothetical protein